VIQIGDFLTALICAFLINFKVKKHIVIADLAHKKEENAFQKQKIQFSIFALVFDQKLEIAIADTLQFS